MLAKKLVKQAWMPKASAEATDEPPYLTTGPYPHYASLHHPTPLTNLQLTRLPSTTIIIKYSTFAKTTCHHQWRFYDLQYANYNNKYGYNCDRQYAFLRKSDDGQTLLIVANFALTPYTLECAFHHMPFPSCASDVDLPLPPT